MKRGKFIAFEGGEGSGKDTMIDRLKAKYDGCSNVIFTREPGGTKVGEKIRSVLLDPDSKPMSVRTEILLFVAARNQLIAQVVAPALAQGKTVISNRFGLSTEAYQIYGRERLQYLPVLQKLTEEFVGDYRPRYVLLNVTPEVGLRRVASRNDGKTRFDAESLAFHRRVREGYLKSVVGYNHTIIDADQPLETVWSEVAEVCIKLIR